MGENKSKLQKGSNNKFKNIYELWVTRKIIEL